MNGKALFIVDSGATVGGLAQGLNDLAVLNAGEVDVRRVNLSDPKSVAECVAQLRDDGPSAVAVGVVDPAVRVPAELAELAAAPGHPLVYLSVGARPDGSPLLAARRRILTHVVVPGDFSVRSGCLAACLRDICRQGASAVTLLHVSHDGSRDCTDSALTRLGRLDVEWCDWIKSRLFRSGVAEVRLVVPNQNDSDSWKQVASDASLVLVGSTCDKESVRAYFDTWRSLAGSNGVPALMFTADGCSAGAHAGAA